MGPQVPPGVIPQCRAQKSRTPITRCGPQTTSKSVSLDNPNYNLVSLIYLLLCTLVSWKNKNTPSIAEHTLNMLQIVFVCLFILEGPGTAQWQCWFQSVRSQVWSPTQSRTQRLRWQTKQCWVARATSKCAPHTLISAYNQERAPWQNNNKKKSKENGKKKLSPPPQWRYNVNS